MPINFSQFYGPVAAEAQAASSALSPNRNPSDPNPVPGLPGPGVATNHAAISWVGVVIALVLLRVLYEVSE